MAGSPLRRPSSPDLAEGDAHSRQTRKMPADVVREVMRAVEQIAPGSSQGQEPRIAEAPPAGARPLAPPLQQPRSGTRPRVSAADIAAFVASREPRDARETLPQIDTYAAEPATLPPPAPSALEPGRTTTTMAAVSIEIIGTPEVPAPVGRLDDVPRRERVETLGDLPELDDEGPRTEPRPSPIPRKRVQIAIPLSTFQPGAYPSPQIDSTKPSPLDEPRNVFFLSMAAVIAVLGPLMYLLLR